MPHLTILIDANSIGYAAHHATKLHSGVMQTQAVYGFLRTVRELRIRNPLATIYVLWDGKAQFRFDMCPEYKIKRVADTPEKVADKEAYKAQLPFIKAALSALGITQILSYIHEADDLAGILVKQIMKNPDQEILLASGDVDWVQLIRRGVRWQDLRDKRNEKVITFENFVEKTGYKTPLAFLEGKALQGDSSDCIPGVGGIGEATAPLFLAEHGSVGKFIQRCERGEINPANKAQRSLWKGTSPYTKEQWKNLFHYQRDDSLSDEENEKEHKKQLKKHMDAYIGQGRSIFIRNMKIMQLINPHPLEKQHLEIDKGNFDLDKFIDICAELNFASILNVIDNFVQPFKQALPTQTN
ncbi:5'-3' exonuclease [Acinetobacter baumannii 26016_8]|uniref:5'-3' exonuclease H3TH domain-containing protein n=1 Tax=Acinetobacter baumannii TaxID=470 RepID=UPI000449C154|nr:5'-3' exonuclease H3TH domain-containing protein [Acinetobacter baumannii]EXU21287.1 5'-3' exonuclease [Acinetobacter baumannii 25253_10]EYR96447.1 5'-3' exonuclease [Acinetobacter baumannii 26016_8]